MHCVVPENIHTPPKEGVFWFDPPWKFQLRFILSLKNFGL